MREVLLYYIKYGTDSASGRLHTALPAYVKHSTGIEPLHTMASRLKTAPPQFKECGFFKILK
jgi:hypothetical protein